MKFITVSKVNFAVLSGVFGYERGDELRRDCDMLLCGFSAFDEIDLRAEINGESACFVSLTDLSKAYGTVVLSGVKTTIDGMKHLSAAVATRGKLIDVVDRTVNLRGDNFLPGNKIKIYKTEKTRAALLIDTDVLLPCNWERVAENCDMVVSLALQISASDAAKVSTLSQLYGLPYLLSAENGLWWGEPSDEPVM